MVYDLPGFRYWTNSVTKNYEKAMSEYDKDGISPVTQFRVFLVESKTDDIRAYVAYDSNGQPFMDWSTPSDFEIKMMLYRNDLRDEWNIVNMARRRSEEE